MACRASGGKSILLCLGLLFVVCCHCTSLPKLKSLAKLRRNLMLNRGQAKGKEWHHGRLLIGQTHLYGANRQGKEAAKKWLDIDADYQADMGFWQPKHPADYGYATNAAVQQILKLGPTVECTKNSMRLQVRDSSSQAALIFVDRGSQQFPLPLSTLPRNCGYSVQSLQRDSVLVARYDGCFVALEEDSYVLALWWLGLPVRMSCPLRQAQSNTPMVTCHPEGMHVKMECKRPVSAMKVKVNGSWEPLTKQSKCGFTVVPRSEDVTISVRYTPCLEIKDGMYTFELSGDEETKVSCPSISPPQPEHPSTPPPPTTPKPTPTSLAPVQKDINEPNLPYFPFYPHLFYPQPANRDHISTTTAQPTSPNVAKPKQPQEPAKNPLYALFYPFNQQPLTSQAPTSDLPPVHPDAPPKQPVLPKPTVSQDTRGKIYQHLYPYMWHLGPTTAPRDGLQSLTPVVPVTPEPYIFPTTQTPEVKKSPQPEMPWVPVYQSLYPFYPWPGKEQEKPTAVPELRQTEAPLGQVYYPFLPYPFYQPVPEKPTAETPKSFPTSQAPGAEVPTVQPPAIRHPEGLLPYPFYPYYYLHQPNYVTLPPVTATQEPRQLTTATSSPVSTGVLTPHPHPSGSYMYCPSYCPMGFINCCPQIAFHQHLHHHGPAAPGRKGSPVYPGLPYFHPAAYSGFGHSSGRVPYPLKPLGVAKTSTAAPVPPHALQYENQKLPHLQPLGGDTATGPVRDPSQARNPEPYPYFVANSLHPTWLHQSRDRPQSLGAQSSMASQTPVPVTPLVQYEPYNTPAPQQHNGQPPFETWNPFGPLSFPNPDLQKDPTPEERRHAVQEPQRSNAEPGRSEEQRKLDELIPYFMLQDPQAPAPNDSTQQSGKGSKNAKLEQTLNAHSDPEWFVPLQGPPGKEHGSLIEPVMPFRPPVPEQSLVQQNPGTPHGGEGKPLQTTQRPKWLRKGISTRLIGKGQDMRRRGVESDSPLQRSPSVPLPRVSSLGASQPNPKFLNSFKGLWKPTTARGSSHGILLPEKATRR